MTTSSQPIDGLRVLAGNDGTFLRTLEMGEPGGILVATHLVGPEMREIYDAVQAGDTERAREIDQSLRPIYEVLGKTNPIPVKAGLELLGICSARARLPIVEADEEQRAEVRHGARGPRPAGGERRLALPSSGVRILPLGGLGEIGKNMTVIEAEGRIVVVDTGLMFPTADMLGIDLVLPDFSSLRERADDIEAIVLTHGHEDHVGALPYVLREIGMPPVIYGGLLTIGMVRSKLDEHKLRDVPLRELPAGEHVTAGPFDIELVHMAHSIPDARAVALTTELGTVLVTGDYKFDQTPVDRIPADVSRLAELGREGLLCLCGDSTNADRPGVAPSESSVGPGSARGLLTLPGTHHRHLLRLQHPPRPAGDRRGRPAGPPRRAGRALDAEELQHRLQPGHGGSAGRALHLSEGGPGLPRR